MDKNILDVSIRDILLTIDSTNNNKFGKFNEKMVEQYFKDGDIDIEMVVDLLSSIFDFRTTVNGVVSKVDSNLLTILSSYEKYSTSGRIPKEYRDWNNIKNIPELVEIINEIDDKVKKEELEKKSRKFYDTEDWLIVQPLSFESSRKYGRNTKWCTTEAKSSFDEYATGDRELFYVINKKTNYKVAVNYFKENPEDIDFYDPEDVTHDFYYFIFNNHLDMSVIEQIKKTVDTLVNEHYETEVEFEADNDDISKYIKFSDYGDYLDKYGSFNPDELFGDGYYKTPRRRY